MSNQLSLKNCQVLPLAEWLNKLILIGKESRFRTRFVKTLTDRLEEVEKTRTELCEKYSAVDAEGKRVYFKKPVEGVKTSPDGTEVKFELPPEETTDESEKSAYKIAEDKVDDFNKEYNDYMGESFVLDVLASNSDTVHGVKKLLLETTDTFVGGGDAVLYDELCTAFEALPEQRMTVDELLGKNGEAAA